jgi:hypothetical protein
VQLHGLDILVAVVRLLKAPAWMLVVPASSVGAKGSVLGHGPPLGPVFIWKVEEALTGWVSDQGVKLACVS